MKHLSPNISEKIAEAWSTGMVSEGQLAEQFNVSRTFVNEAIAGTKKRGSGVKAINRNTLSLARDLYSSMPTELTRSFSRRFEDITGGHAGLLVTPGL